MKFRPILFLTIMFLPACDLDEEILDEVSGDLLMEQEGAEHNLAAPSYAHLARIFNGDGNSIRMIGENVSDEFVIPIRR